MVCAAIKSYVLPILQNSLFWKKLMVNDFYENEEKSDLS